MKKEKINLTDPEVTKRILERIKRMTPEELHDFMTYRTPGVPETDMTDMFAAHAAEERAAREAQEKREAEAALG